MRYITLDEALSKEPCEPEDVREFFGTRKKIAVTGENLKLASEIFSMAWITMELLTLDDAEVAIKSGDAYLNYCFAICIQGADVAAHGKTVIESGDAEYNHWFAMDVTGADTEAHAKVVLESGDPQWNYRCARDIQGVDIEAHGKAVQESGTNYLNYLFSRDIRGADVKAHGKVVLESGHKYWINKMQELQR